MRFKSRQRTCEVWEETLEEANRREQEELIDAGRDDDDFFGELTPPDK